MKRTAWTMRQFMTYPILLVLLLFIAANESVYAASEVFHEFYDTPSGESLTVSNRNGDVVVKSWDNENIEVYAKKRAERTEDLQDVRIEVTVGSTIEIETVHLVRNPQVSVDYRIHVPAHVGVPSVQSSNGDVELSDIRGDVTVKTSNGEVVMTHIGGNVEADTSNGDVTIQDVEGLVYADTSNSDILIRNVQGVLEAETSNGSIVTDIPAMPADKVRIKASNGPITLYVSDRVNARIKMKTSNGRILINHPRIPPRTASRKTFEGTIGNGGNLLSVKTSNNTITLERL